MSAYRLGYQNVTQGKYAPDLSIHGISGTRLSGGVISGVEKNPRLNASRWISEAEEMLRTDPRCAISWRLLKHTILEANWKWIPSGDDEKSLELARYANEAFGFEGAAGQTSKPFEEMLQYLLQFIPIGYRYAEEIYCIKRSETGKMMVFLSEYADRQPSAHMHWLEDQGVLQGVSQRMIGTIKPEPIPANKLLLLTMNQEGNNYEGVGFLRSCWYPWRSKQRCLNLLGVALERFAIPTPLIQVDRSLAETQGLTDSDLDVCIDRASAQAAAYISQEQSYLVESLACKFSTYGDGKLDTSHMIAAIDKYNQEISSAFMTGFTDLGVSTTGSRSVGEVHQSQFRRLALNCADQVAATIGGVDRPGGGTIDRLIKMNYGPVLRSQLPRLVHYGLDSDELADSISGLPSLVQSGLLTATDGVEQALRTRVGLGELEEESQRSSYERSLGGMGLGSTSALSEKYRQLRGRNGTQDKT